VPPITITFPSNNRLQVKLSCLVAQRVPWLISPPVLLRISQVPDEFDPPMINTLLFKSSAAQWSERLAHRVPFATNAPLASRISQVPFDSRSAQWFDRAVARLPLLTNPPLLFLISYVEGLCSDPPPAIKLLFPHERPGRIKLTTHAIKHEKRHITHLHVSKFKCTSSYAYGRRR